MCLQKGPSNSLHISVFIVKMRGRPFCLSDSDSLLLTSLFLTPQADGSFRIKSLDDTELKEVHFSCVGPAVRACTGQNGVNTTVATGLLLN